MTSVDAAEAAPRPLRLWPGVVLGAFLLISRFVAPAIAPDLAMVGVLAAFAAVLGIILWWLFFSRATWSERLGALALAVVAMLLTHRLLDQSVARGNMGFQYILVALPILALALVAWAASTRSLSPKRRRASLVATILVTCGAWTLVRSEGVESDGMPELTWRWTQSAEQRLLAAAGDQPRLASHEAGPPGGVPSAVVALPEPAAPAEVSSADGYTPLPSEAPAPISTETTQRPLVPSLSDDGPEPAAIASAPAVPEPWWPGLRGAGRDGVVTGGVRLDRDWARSPPTELWRRPIGPGVSSFAVDATRLYTQEQRGDDELVSSYDLATGEPMWRHHDPARFWDPHVGAGPRATPALGHGVLYSLGATGILNALDAASGAVVWSRNAAADAGKDVPLWGFVSSPLIVDDLLIVQAGLLIAYDRATGEPRWRGPSQRGSYSSPQLLELGGVPQIVQIGHANTISVSPSDGSLLWEHAWQGIGIVQPAQVGSDGLLLSLIDAGAAPLGTRRIAVDQGSAGWRVEERWTSTRLRTSFSDVVVHRDHAYGFDGRMLVCVDLETGDRVWKGGRYGEGQALLLPDQDLLLVLGERGDLALVEARPDSFHELGRVSVLTAKTWAQPALVGDIVLVRNGEEVAAFRLPCEH